MFYALVLSALVVAGICLWNAVRWMDTPSPGFLFNQRMVVGYLGLHHWSGIKAGLNYPDKILEANGRPVSSKMDLERIVASVPRGEPILYTIEREGKRLTVPVPTMLFAVSDLLLTFGILVFLGILYLITGTGVFVLRPDTTVSWLFFTGCLLEGLSSFISFDLESTHAGFFRLMILCDVLLPAIVLHLSFLFPQETELVGRRPYLPAIPYGLAAVLTVALEISYPAPLFFSLYGSVLIFMVLGAASLIIATLRAYFRGTSTLARQRAKVVLFGSVLAFPIPVLAPLASFMGMTLGGEKIVTNLAAIPLIVFPFSIAYAIARHNLFDVDVFIKRTVGYAIMTALVAGAYWGIQVLLETFVVGPLLGAGAEKIYPFVFALLVVFLFNPLNRRVQDAVDRMFYRKKFDYKETVLSVGEALSSVLDRNEIVRKVVHTVRDTMYIDTSGLVLAGAQGEMLRGHFIGDAAENRGDGGGDRGGDAGAEREAEREESIPSDDPLVYLVARERKMITKYDVAEDPRFADVRESCGKRFEEMGASLAVPLVHKGEIKGILTVGHKKSGHFFTREDIDLIQTLASHGAVAIENANMAEQMKKEETVRTNLSRYLSPQIVDKIVKDDVKVNLGGDRKVVTVLFSDIRNFTTITENRPPDQLVAILNEYFTEMAQVIFDHQGSLDKYIGDAIVAVFGSLIPLENPAQNAVQASIKMMEGMNELNRRWEARYGFSMHIGIGINTGEVFLGNIGSPERMEFTVIGDAVNVASRFSGLAKAGQVLVTRETRAQLGDKFTVREHPPATVKGKTEPLSVYEILPIPSSSRPRPIS